MRKLHILLVRFSSLGDIVLASSVISFLRYQAGEQVRLSFLTSKQFAPLLEGHGLLDHVYSFSRSKGLQGMKELIHLVKDIHQQHRVDLILDLHGTLRSLLIRSRFWFIPRIAVDKRTFERSLLTFLKIDFLSQQGLGDGEENQFNIKRKAGFGELLLARNIRDFSALFNDDVFEKSFSFERYLQQISCFLEKKSVDLNQKEQLQLSSCALTFKSHQEISLAWKKWNIPDLADKTYICIIPSASFPEKRWPADRFQTLLRLAMGHPHLKEKKFLLLAGPTDEFCRVFDQLESEFPQQFFNLQGKTNLLESTLILKKSFFCVGNDTGLPHLSESVGTPAIFILGPTGEEFGFYPHLKLSQVMSVKLWCRPCTTNGKGNCIRSERFCLTQIAPTQVLESMLQLSYQLNCSINK